MLARIEVSYVLARDTSTRFNLPAIFQSVAITKKRHQFYIFVKSTPHETIINAFIWVYAIFYKAFFSTGNYINVEMLTYLYQFAGDKFNFILSKISYSSESG